MKNQKSEQYQNLFLNIIDYFISLVIDILPQAPFANNLKCFLMRQRGAIIGKRVKIWSGVWLDNYTGLHIGDDVTIGRGAIFVTGGGVYIGDRTMIAHGSKIISVGHRIPDGRESMRFSGPDKSPIHISNDVWVCTQSVVLPGVTIGEGALIAAGAVVTKDVPAFAVVGGIPARILRMRQ